MRSENSVNHKFAHAILILAYLLCSGLVIYQVATLTLPAVTYYIVVLIFAIAISISYFDSSTFLTVTGLFIFGFVIRIIYFVSTNFKVLPFGDPYSAYGLLNYTLQSHHISILQFQPFFIPLNSAAIYSQWPGFDLLSASLVEITGFTPFQVALILPSALYFVSFLLAYLILKGLITKTGLKVHNWLTLCLTIVVSDPYFMLPLLFKYSTLATVLVLTALLLLLSFDGSRMFSLIIVYAGLIITHSITSVFWLGLIALLVIGAFIARSNKLSKESHSYHFLPNFSDRAYNQLKKFFLVILSLMIAWLVFSGTFVISFFKAILLILFQGSLFLAFQQVSLGNPLSSYAPVWVTQLLQIRNAFFLIALVLGTLVLLFKPKTFKDRTIATILLAITLLSAAFSFIPSFGTYEFLDYSFLLFAPILAMIISMPLVIMFSHRDKLARFASVGMIMLLLFTAAVGLWAAQYAPVPIYDPNVSPISFGEHPLTYSGVTNFFGHLSNPSCILTNEEYVASLSIPFRYWNVSGGIWSARTNPGCIVVLYQGFNASVSYILEVENLYPGFNYLQFNAIILSSSASRIFDTGFSSTASYPTIYYIN